MKLTLTQQLEKLLHKSKEAEKQLRSAKIGTNARYDFDQFMKSMNKILDDMYKVMREQTITVEQVTGEWNEFKTQSKLVVSDNMSDEMKAIRMRSKTDSFINKQWIKLTDEI